MRKSYMSNRHLYYYANTSRSDKYASVKIHLKDTRFNLNRVLKFKVDTCASITIVPAKFLDLDMTEEEFKTRFKPARDLAYGFVLRQAAIIYKWNIEKLDLDSEIEFKHFPINITFDEQAQSCLLGYDFIRAFIFTLDPMHRLMLFSETDISRKYNGTGLDASDIEQDFLRQIKQNNATVDISEILNLFDNAVSEKEIAQSGSLTRMKL